MSDRDRSVQGYFLSAQDARRAANLLKTLYGVEVRPMERPVNGRSWALVVRMPSSLMMSPMYVDPEVLNGAVAAIMRYNGIVLDPVP